ncbi:Sodium/calcium exchanger protein-domain-containing protein [Dendryphion nanum]|uniref:Sodium/calcium exchanger protein-domain-containing protein n=1 Tax=Dendryphion nanum TaxID=256645 RepID=A0A9P9E4Q6_9PLEO|nr:Sodium/calcium exchanger protein-domain-containing protein [Dendryphion nanum]
MHHVVAESLLIGEDRFDRETGIRCYNPFGKSQVTVTESEEIINGLPSHGYRVYDQRRSLSLPATPYSIADGYISFDDIHDTKATRYRMALISSLKYVVRHWSNFLLLFVPIGILAPQLGFGDSAVFILNCIAIVPLADVLCRATDDISSFLGETTGALLNVTMGNATEVVIFVHALLQRQYMIVRTSLLGSIIVNILLVLGLAIMTGELRQRGQVYNVLATRVAAGLLCLTTISLLVPSTLRTSPDSTKLARDILNLSRAISIVLMVVYMVYLSTQLNSSKFAYKPLIQLDPDTPSEPEIVQITEIRRTSYHRRTLSYPRNQIPDFSFDDLPAHNPVSSFQSNTTRIARLRSLAALVRAIPWVHKACSIFTLIVSTGLISLCGSSLVDTIDHFVDHSPISKTMVGLIILPIVGNAAELVSGIIFARRKQMDLAFAVSIGSAIQIALLVTPMMVIVGWGMGREMSLHFSVFEAVTLIASTVLFMCLILDDRCSALKGASLLAGYSIISITAYFVPGTGT